MSRKKSQFYKCPKCAARGLEIFETHSYCVNCNYSSEDKYFFNRKEMDVGPIPKWAKDALKDCCSRQKDIELLVPVLPEGKSCEIKEPKIVMSTNEVTGNEHQRNEYPRNINSENLDEPKSA